MGHYKSGRYGIYKGIEYKINFDENKNMLILTRNIELIDDSFEDTYNSGTYSKIIQLEDLEEYYDITTYAIWNGMKFLLDAEKEDCYILYTWDLEIARKYGFKVCDRAEFRKEVSKDSVELVEEREDLM